MFPAEPNDVMEAKIGAGGHGGDKFYFLSITVAGDRKRRRLARGGKAGVLEYRADDIAPNFVPRHFKPRRRPACFCPV